MENLKKQLQRQKEYTIDLNRMTDKLNERIENLNKKLEIKDSIIQELLILLSK